jgi:hypothetical protein
MKFFVLLVILFIVSGNAISIPNATYTNALVRWEIEQGNEAAKVLDNFPR